MKNKKINVDLPRFILLLSTIAIVSFSASAQAQVEAQEDKTLSPYFFVKGDPKSRPTAAQGNTMLI